MNNVIGTQHNSQIGTRIDMTINKEKIMKSNASKSSIGIAMCLSVLQLLSALPAQAQPNFKQGSRDKIDIQIEANKDPRSLQRSAQDAKKLLLKNQTGNDSVGSNDLSTSVNSVAGGSSDGGGNAVAIKFIEEARRAIGLVSSKLQDFPEFQNESSLDKILSEVSHNVIVSTESIFVEINGKLQESTAKSEVTSSGYFKITLNGNQNSNVSVYKITDANILSALAFHELCVLLGIEKTGDYHVSQRYLRQLKVICTSGICAPNDITNVYMTAKADKIYNIPAQNQIVIENPRFEYSTPIPVDGIQNVSSLKIYAGNELWQYGIWGNRELLRNSLMDKDSSTEFCALYGLQVVNAELEDVAVNTDAAVAHYDAKEKIWVSGEVTTFKGSFNVKLAYNHFTVRKIFCKNP